MTRPRPEIDRVACAWLIRSFIDPKATFKFATNASGYIEVCVPRATSQNNPTFGLGGPTRLIVTGALTEAGANVATFPGAGWLDADTLSFRPPNFSGYLH